MRREHSDQQRLANDALSSGTGHRLSDQVASEIEGRVVRGDLKPGERLPSETDLGAILNVSRSVIRDALRTLAARGLVRVRQGQGILVAEPTNEAYGEAIVVLLLRSDILMRDVIAARALIETQLGQLAATRGTADDWKVMQNLLDTFVSALESERWEDAERQHLAFHLALLNAIHEPALSLLLKPMHEIILVSSTIPKIDVTELWGVPVHYEILEGLHSGDQDATAAALRAHFALFDDERYNEWKTILFRDAASHREEELARTRSRPSRADGAHEDN